MSTERPKLEKGKAEIWGHPEMLVDVEKGRYSHERTLRKEVSDVFRQYVSVGASVFEVGSGLGFLKTLVPTEYHSRYFNSDYSVQNLAYARNVLKRDLKAVTASAYELPLPNNSTDCVVDLDAYDTFPNLERAMEEVKRVLKPDGTFIHFQVNYPSDDTVEEDYPDLIWFPARFGSRHERLSMVGMTRENLEKGVKTIKTPPFRGIVEDFLNDPKTAYTRLISSDKAPEYVDMLHAILDVMPVDRLVIPSLPDYFRNKLERFSTQAGLTVAESNYRSTVIRGARSAVQKKWPQFNSFCLEQGSSFFSRNSELMVTNSLDVIEKVSMLAFVAKK